MKSSLTLLLLLALLLLSTAAYPSFRHRNNHKRSKVRLMVRKGSKLDHLHRKTMNDWRKAYFYHERRKGDFALDDILSQMDSFVRPRFG
ncbi:hypothetical protein QR680_001659 [Steinernema hermaphroditum]|uniref:Cathepsin propeptide inhibitor domain-containing protein n=1 Tax=Steinernema hermaphroditum TaxID=289476 RepID=A0AA39GZ85_9BILA|nr:hypothetical protein QR680_001659 [Steinernema hermaphroditum]